MRLVKWLALAGCWLWMGPLAVAGEPKVLLSDGVKIQYYVEGAGEPVILIHGFGANAQVQWDLPGITKTLAKEYRVIALDNRGHGRSGKPIEQEKYGVEMVHDVIRLLDHEGIDKAHIVGYSMGAFITNKLVTMHPRRALSATLGGAGWAQEGMTNNLDEIAEALEQGKGIGPLLRFLTPPGRPAPTDEQLKPLNQLFMTINDPKALAAAARGMRQLTVTEAALTACPVPTLAIVGDLDPLKAGVVAMKGKKPHLRTVILPGATHMDAFNKPQFIKHVTEFLAEQRSLVPAGK